MKHPDEAKKRSTVYRERHRLEERLRSSQNRKFSMRKNQWQRAWLIHLYVFLNSTFSYCIELYEAKFRNKLNQSKRHPGSDPKLVDMIKELA
ncbi:MAG: hypothetical protein GY861_15375 [bacterium]|nr:hypothetical protein [bacterium]